ncbi:MAG: YicC family protein [Proteobacteria bacterium]|nr:YicC family protein [Pseudomonadota bacterium]
MTAFASAERNTPWGTLACDLRAVNHRFFELGLRLPEELRPLEAALRERLAQKIARGKVDVSLRLRAPEGAVAELQPNHALLMRLSELANDLDTRFPGMHTDFVDLLRFPGVLDEARPDAAGLQAEALALLDAGVAEFLAAREREGGKLAAVMIERLDAIAALVAQVRAWMPEIRAGLRAKFQARIADLKQPLEPGRIEQEIVLGLQKLDVEEELDRLDSHLAEARRVLELPEAVGRRLDFLMQEFNREANTLGSKSIDARTSQASVELKVLIEQLREQVQNLE